MYGWRGRLGVILGRPNAVCEPEFNKMVPEGVTVHCTRMGGAPILDYGASEAMERHKELAAKLSDVLRDVKPNVIIFAHTAASMGDGPKFNHKLTEIMEQASELKALTAATAIVEALNAFGVKHIGMSVPFPLEPDLTSLVKNFLEHPASGFKVVNISSVRGENPYFITNMTPDVAYQFGRKADHPDAEAILLAGSVWRSIEIIETLEHDLKKPVISANQATIWAALKRIEVDVSDVKGYGTLFRH